MHHQQATYIPSSEPCTQNKVIGYLIADVSGNILYADRSTGPLKNMALPASVRELFPCCLPACEGMFAACLATGQSQGQLQLQPAAGKKLAVDAHCFLCPAPGDTAQIMMTLRAAADAQPCLPPAPATQFQGLDALFIASQPLAQVGNFKLDFNSLQVEWTPAMFQIYRLPEDAQGLPFLDFLERIHPADRDAFLHQSQQARLGGLPLKTEIRILRGDNTQGAIQITAQTYTNEAGEVAGLFGTAIDITCFKEKEDRLRQALTKLEKVMKNSPDILLSIDQTGIILHINKAVETIMGYTPAELIGQHYGLHLVPQDLSRTDEQLKQVKAGVIINNFQNQGICKDGSLVTFSWSAYWSEEEQHFFCVGRDTTELQEAQNQLVASEERFRLLAENGSDMMCILSPAGQYTFVSGSINRILGHNPEALLGQSPFDLMHPDDLPAIRKCFEQIYHTHHLAYPPYRVRAANGGWRWMETIITNYLEHPFIQGFATTCRDITERRQEELKTRESEQRYKSLFEHHPDPVYSLNLEGQFVTANRWVSYLTGYSADAIIGKNFQELIIPELLPDTLAHFSWCRQGYSRTYKTAVADGKGNRLDLEVTNIPIIIDGQVTGIYGIAKDITQLKKARRERRQLISRLEQKNHNLEQFAYIVSHNLRAPVANILGLTGLFNNQESDQDLNQQVITNLQRSAESLDAIIQGLNQILLNRLELDQPQEEVCLPALLASIQSTLKEDIIRSQAVIQTDFTQVSTVYTIKSYLHNILLSLIRNALHNYNPDQTPVVKIRATRIESKICLTIQDNSLNLNRQKHNSGYRARRFDNSRDNKDLSLQLIRTQVKALGGKVEMNAEPGPCSTFKLYLKH